MPEYLKAFIGFVSHHPYISYGAIFFVALSESLAFVGLLMPGAILMVGIGAVVSTGVLSLKNALLAAMAGAIAGDSISYWLGRCYKDKLSLLWPFNRHPQLLERGKTFFHHYGGKSVFLARFVGPVRPVVPLVAGMFHMPPGKFTLINLISAIGWAPAYILPGVLFGASLALAAKVSARLAILFLVSFASLWFSLWLFRKIVRWLDQRIPKGEKRLTFTLTCIFFLAGLGSAAILWHIFLATPLLRMDHAVFYFMQAIRTSSLDRFFLAWTELGDAAVNIPVSFAVLFFLLFYKNHRGAVFWSIAVMGGAVLTKLFQIVLQVPKPMPLYQSLSAWSFPGGHVVMTVVIYGFLSILLTRKLHKTWRWLPFWGTFIFFGGISFSRLYLGVHWFTDILVGLFLGAVWTTLVGLFYLKTDFESFPKHRLIIVTLLTLGLAGGWNIASRDTREYQEYVNQKIIHQIDTEKWWDGEWASQPAWRIDLGGEKKTPLTIQWSGKKSTLVETFLANGWEKPDPFSLKASLTMLSPDADINELPVFPRFHQGRLEDLILVRKVASERWVLRLWSTDYSLQPENYELLVGTTEREGIRKIANFITIPVDLKKYQISQPEIANPLCRLAQCRVTVRSADQVISKRLIDWNGEIILARENRIESSQ